MVINHQTSQESAFGKEVVQRGSTMHADRRTILRNHITGKRQQVLLFSPHDKYFEQKFLADENAHPELHADLTAALSTFSPIEKRIILRVLLQGQSVREATKRMKGSSRSWERWFEKALPRIQAALEDYRAEIMRYGAAIEAQSVEGELPVEEEPENKPAKCKFCPHIAVNFNALRLHSKGEHSSEYARAQRFVHERDYEIHRDTQLLREDDTEGE